MTYHLCVTAELFSALFFTSLCFSTLIIHMLCSFFFLFIYFIHSFLFCSHAHKHTSKSEFGRIFGWAIGFSTYTRAQFYKYAHVRSHTCTSDIDNDDDVTSFRLSPNSEPISCCMCVREWVNTIGCVCTFAICLLFKRLCYIRLLSTNHTKRTTCGSINTIFIFVFSIFLFSMFGNLSHLLRKIKNGFLYLFFF